MIDETNINEEVKITKILVTTDGSPESIKGITHAVQMAKEKNAEVIAVHVDTTFIDTDPRAYTAFASISKRKIKEISLTNSETADILNKYYEIIRDSESLILGKAGLEFAVATGKKQGVKVKTIIERGRAAETILKIAEQEAVNLIIMGSKGVTGLDKILMGSVADKVNKLARCPVLIVK